jgi:hypothetical protein
MNQSNTSSPEQYSTLSYVGSWHGSDLSTKSSPKDKIITSIETSNCSAASNERTSLSRGRQHLVEAWDHPGLKYQQCTPMQRWLAQRTDEEIWSAMVVSMKDFLAQNEQWPASKEGSHSSTACATCEEGSLRNWEYGEVEKSKL